MIDTITNLNNLFRQKKYFQVIEKIEAQIPEENRNSLILNLLATCRLLKGKPTLIDYELAIDEFRNSYLKEKKTLRAQEALLNFINLSLVFFHNQKNLNKKFNPNLFKEAINFFLESRNYFNKNEKLILAIIRVYRCIADSQNVLICLKTLIDKNYINLSILLIYIFFNNYSKNFDQKTIYNASKNIEKYLPLFPNSNLIEINFNKKSKINLGFLSSDIKSNHSITYFLESVLKNQNKKIFEISIFSNIDEDKEDQTTESFKKLVSKFVNIKKLNDIQAINLIRKENIDIMVDLMGITSESRINLFRQRVSPVQILWCGYCGTTGLTNMDYLIADKNLILENEKKYFSEKIIYLENIWNAHNGFNFKREENSPPFLKNSYITFGSLNNLRKINDDVVDAWSKILLMVKNSKLILKGSSEIDPSFIIDKFKQRSVDSSIEFKEYNSQELGHLDLYKDIDIALDTFPYNGVTTSFEAFWMGVPVITMKGYNFNSRCGESILKNMNLEELISMTVEDYVQKAVNLSKDKSKLLDIRKKIFNNALNSPLFDSKSFSRDFYNSLENTYKN